MLTIDDPELEQLIHEEVARTGEEPATLLRRFLVGARAAGAERPLSDGEAAGEAFLARNGIPVLPPRPDDHPVTVELVKRLLGEDA